MKKNSVIVLTTLLAAACLADGAGTALATPALLTGASSAAACEAPRGLTATAGTEASCVRLSWTASSGATGYTVYRATGGSADSASAKCLGFVNQPEYADSQATPGVDYTYFVKAKDGGGASGFSTGASGWRALAAPASVTASDGTSTDCVKVWWKAASGACAYRVYRGTNEVDLTALSGWIGDLSYSDTNAVAGTLYSYAVRAALDAAGTRASGLSVVDTGIRERANVPEALVISGPSSLASGAQGTYTSSSRWSNGSTTTVTPTWTCDGKASMVATFTYTAPVVSASKTVTLTAKATVEGADLTATHAIAITPAVPTAPSAPATAPGTSSGVTLSWSAVSDASSYVVYRGASTAPSSATKVGTVTGTTFTDTSVMPGQTVYYFLAAVNAAGTSALSAASAAAVRALAAPTGVTASHGTYTDKVRVTWSAVPGATHYRVSRSASPSGWQTDLGNWQTETTYDDTSATAGTTYSYFVRAATSSAGADAGAKSAGAKGLRKVAVTLSSLAISGADRVDAGSTAIYTVRATDSDGTTTTVSPTWSIASGSGATMNATGKLTAASVTADAAVTIQATFADGGVTMTATKSVAILAPRVARVSVSNVKATSRWPWKPVIDIDYTLTASPADTKARVRVEARDEDRLHDLRPMALSGDGATGSVGAGPHRISWTVADDYPNFSASKVSIDVKASVASVGVPTNLSASAGVYTDKVVVSWTAVDDATGYEVWRGTSSATNSATKLATVETVGYSDTSATAGTTYYYWIKSKDDSSTSEFSTVITGYVKRSVPSATYVVIDLSGGTDAASYPVTELTSVPSGGWSDEYKTSKLVLRRIAAGSFTMGGHSTDYPDASDDNLHTVTLTKDFYMGVFEVTQKQWELVMGTKPSYFSNASYYATRPVEQVTYTDIRGSSAGAGWPSSAAVDATSFLGKIRVKTGLEGFDLPTEAQWEYACRAGTTTALNSGKNLTSPDQDANMAEVGRYGYDDGCYGGIVDGKGGNNSNHTTVGSYAPNAWGLYDMHGNVWEWCLDWGYDSLGTSAVIDPVGAASGSLRLLRGGGWHSLARNCRSALRNYIIPSGVLYDRGFRLSLRDLNAASDAVSVTFDANGGLTAVSSQVYANGAQCSSLPVATRDGYVFAGWYTAPSGGTKVTQESIVSTAIQKLYAHWQGCSYLVVDLSGGTSATSYAVSYLEDVPSDGWTAEYKTTKLVLRRIKPGTFTMGSPAGELGRISSVEDQHTVTLTKEYYMGVFEVTQKQYSLVMGNNPSEYIGDMRPVDCVSYDNIRGASAGAKWPSSSAVDATSFLGKLRAKTGLNLDLPTDAQWEYACRAGTTTALNSGKNLTCATQDANMAEVGRYGYDDGCHGGIVDGKGGYNSNHTTVGSYAPNAWGLYDMHGNVWEWCLDWMVSSGALGTSAVIDPVGPTSGSYRVTHSGSWYDNAQYCRSAYRGCDPPSRTVVLSGRGFRLSLR